MQLTSYSTVYLLFGSIMSTPSLATLPLPSCRLDRTPLRRPYLSVVPLPFPFRHGVFLSPEYGRWYSTFGMGVCDGLLFRLDIT
jgi:hypothetical protein